MTSLHSKLIFLKILSFCDLRRYSNEQREDVTRIIVRVLTCRVQTTGGPSEGWAYTVIRIRLRHQLHLNVMGGLGAVVE